MNGSVNVPGASAADLAKVKKVADAAATAAGNAQFTVTVTDGVAGKTFAEIAAAVDAGKSIRLLYVDTTTGAEELLTFAGYGQDHDFLCFFNIIDSYLRLIEIRSDEALNVYEGAISLSGHRHDDRYLKLTGGTVSGDVTIGKDRTLTITSYLDFCSGDGGISIYEESNDAEHPVLSFYGMNGDECVQLDHIETPASDYQAANKKYVDDAVKGSDHDELHQHYWKRTKHNYSIVQGESQALQLSSESRGTTEWSIEYADTIELDSINRVVNLVNPSTLVTTYNEFLDDGEQLLGKYVTKSGYVWYIDADADHGWDTDSDDSVCHIASGAHRITVDYNAEITYVCSADRDAYPDHGVSNGYEYQYIGTPLDNAVKASRIATGSYNGTGTYGVDNPCSLTFDFVPEIVFIMAGAPFTMATDKSGFAFIACYMKGHSTMWDITTNPYRTSNQDPAFLNTVSAEGNSISWYANADYSQLNIAGFPYRYFAIS